MRDLNDYSIKDIILDLQECFKGQEYPDTWLLEMEIKGEREGLFTSEAVCVNASYRLGVLHK